MAISIRKSGARSRKKRENLLMKQLQRLEEIKRQEEEARKLEEERRREAERAKRREEELRLEELRLQEMLLREMDRMRLRTDRKRGKRLWTAEERMAQRVFAAALMETAAASAAAHQAEQRGYAEGRMEVLSAGGGKPGLHRQAERSSQLVAVQGGRSASQARDGSPTGRLAEQQASGDDSMSADKRTKSAGFHPKIEVVVAQLEEKPAMRRRTAWLHDRRMRLGPARSPCGECVERGSFGSRKEEVTKGLD
ncbi:hypothetical protein ACLBWT_21725 [Paenibacillus sp. D51F]